MDVARNTIGRCIDCKHISIKKIRGLKINYKNTYKFNCKQEQYRDVTMCELFTPVWWKFWIKKIQESQMTNTFIAIIFF